MLQFHSKAKLLTDIKLLNAGMPATALKDLSNFSEHRVEYNGLVFPSVEAAFQSQKYSMAQFKDVEITKAKAEEIIRKFAAWGPLEAKKNGGRKGMDKFGFTLNVELWEKESVSIMKALIKSKIEKNPDIQNILKIAKQFQLSFAHFSRSDMKWGCHLEKDGSRIKVGDNLLGDIFNKWMYDSPEGIDFHKYKLCIDLMIQYFLFLTDSPSVDAIVGERTQSNQV